MKSFGIKYVLFFFSIITAVVQGWIWNVKSPSARFSLSSIRDNIDVKKGDTFNLRFELTQNFPTSYDVIQCVSVYFTSKPRKVTTLPGNFTLCTSHPLKQKLNFALYANDPGKVTIISHTTDKDVIDVSEGFTRVSVDLDDGINVAGDVLGWIYTIAWDASFLPQIVHNWRRHSVDGLSFDFLTLNFLGFFSYFIFNIGLYTSDEIKDEFMDRNPYGVLHVRLNDVIFPAYALLCTMVQIAQCFALKKSPGQRVSTTCRIISSLLVVSILVGVILIPTVQSLDWLDLLYWCSYVKLFITAIKYCPQLYVNYKNKSTKGWSIWQVILDFTGGSFSLIQMFMLAANYDDWKSLLTDPAKLGLGLLSILFNILFFIQHYGLYRNKGKPEDKLDKVDMDVVVSDK